MTNDTPSAEQLSANSTARYNDEYCSICGYNRPRIGAGDGISPINVQYCYYLGNKIEYSI